MIIHLQANLSPEQVALLAAQTESVYYVNQQNVAILITSSKVKEVPVELLPYYTDSTYCDSDIQLASKAYINQKRAITIGKQQLGGESRNSMIIGGPCSIESWEQIEESAKLMVSLGVSTLRAGCYKPRTSPYSFQGLGLEGLKMLDKIRDKYQLNIITEVRDGSHIDEVIAYADVVQVGAKAMYDQAILRKCGASRKPILIKRGFGTTLQEFVQAAEFVLSGGNEQVILCERGIRTFETKTRFTLDLCGVAYLKEYTNLPIILDPSHAMGYRYGVADLSRACLALDIDGLLIECHPTPEQAKSDASQQLNHEEFTQLFGSLQPIAQAVNRKLI